MGIKKETPELFHISSRSDLIFEIMVMHCGNMSNNSVGKIQIVINWVKFLI